MKHHFYQKHRGAPMDHCLKLPAPVTTYSQKFPSIRARLSAGMYQKNPQTSLFYSPSRFFFVVYLFVLLFLNKLCKPGQHTLKADRNDKSGSVWMVPLDPSTGCSLKFWKENTGSLFVLHGREFRLLFRLAKKPKSSAKLANKAVLQQAQTHSHSSWHNL